MASRVLSWVQRLTAKPSLTVVCSSPFAHSWRYTHLERGYSCTSERLLALSAILLPLSHPNIPSIPHASLTEPRCKTKNNDQGGDVNRYLNVLCVTGFVPFVIGLVLYTASTDIFVTHHLNAFRITSLKTYGINLK